eukprot:scaffold97354_cov63-Phaeocystis_antarctica.AAC.1
MSKARLTKVRPAPEAGPRCGPFVRVRVRARGAARLLGLGLGPEVRPALACLQSWAAPWPAISGLRLTWARAGRGP